MAEGVKVVPRSALMNEKNGQIQHFLQLNQKSSSDYFPKPNVLTLTFQLTAEIGV